MTKRSVGVLAALLAVSACTSTPPRPQASTPEQAKHAESVDLGAGETFLPPPQNAQPALSALDAWRVYAAHATINRTHLPPGTFAKLGVFVDGGGRHHLAYGYFTPNSTPLYTGLVKHPVGQRCTRWDMLSAESGRQIESSWTCSPATIPRNR